MQSYTSARHRFFCLRLIEPFKDFVQLVRINTRTRVFNIDNHRTSRMAVINLIIIVYGNRNTYHTVSRRMLECIRQYIHDYLVEITRINPGLNFRLTRNQIQANPLNICLIFKICAHIADNFHDITLSKTKPHLPFVDFANIHQLVN